MNAFNGVELQLNVKYLVMKMFVMLMFLLFAPIVVVA